MFNVETNKTYEIIVSENTALIAKLVEIVPGGYIFFDEIKNDKFALSNETVLGFVRL